MSISALLLPSLITSLSSLHIRSIPSPSLSTPTDVLVKVQSIGCNFFDMCVFSLFSVFTQSFVSGESLHRYRKYVGMK